MSFGQSCNACIVQLCVRDHNYLYSAVHALIARITTCVIAGVATNAATTTETALSLSLATIPVFVSVSLRIYVRDPAARHAL